MLENIFSTSMLGQRQKSFSAESKLSNARGCFSCSQTIGRERGGGRERLLDRLSYPARCRPVHCFCCCSLRGCITAAARRLSGDASAKPLARARILKWVKSQGCLACIQVLQKWLSTHWVACCLRYPHQLRNEIQPTPYSHYDRWKFNFKYFGQLEENFDEALYAINRTRYDQELLKWYHTIVPRPGKWYR